ncbi:hypothetical protein AB0L53_31835 [Nonomuraea sp. NPDC052129]|uniref:hypothetical protein n=1 Tax=Nonomuraea sp. NPDC052129 TaxID=3154651 RepID=UPI00341B2B29
MGTEAFYTTAAQVLPTLLIALAVEVGFLLQIFFGEKKKPGRARAAAGEIAKWGGGFMILGRIFLFGEVLALAAIAFRWFNGWTFAGVGLCLLIMLGAVVYIPTRRLLRADLSSDKDEDEDEDEG